MAGPCVVAEEPEPPSLAQLLPLSSSEPTSAGNHDELPLGALPILTPEPLLGLRGILNLGQTCFMAAILQIMVHTPPLQRFFLADKHNRLKCAIERSQKIQTTRAQKNACLACEMQTVISEFFSGNHDPYSPHSFLHAIWCWSEHFANCEQHDAHEFLLVLLAGIFDGVCGGGGSVPSPSLPSISTLQPNPNNGGLTVNANCRDLKSIFYAALRSEVVCKRCGGKSSKSEECHDISLDIPALNDGASVSLISCLASFTQEEQLCAAERCWCSTCGSLQDSSKRMSLQRLPNVLCIHLKRFKQSMDAQRQTSKLDTFVDFPLQALNMYPYTSAYIESATSLDSVLAAPPAAQHLYDLFGVAVHHGTMQNGHYTSYIRRHAHWYNCDDANISTVDPSHVRLCKAYMLFYIRKKLC